ncbi:MAG: cysteine desulfurase [Candidatus Omnitrophica bacterium]|nr:cysteine desulfurase [Candidatus Omnitrophota bacterium]
MIYLDHFSATPIDPRVSEAMLPYWNQWAWNPGSPHTAGRRVRDAVEKARVQVASLIGARPGEIHFVSSATEANNWALYGLPRGLRNKGKHLAISSTESKAVLYSAHRLEEDEHYRLSLVEVSAEGLLDLSSLRECLCEESVVVSVAHASAELGALQPLPEIAEAAHGKGARLHVDCTATAGRVLTQVKDLGADTAVIASDQIYGPSGAAALYVRRGVRIRPLLVGGTQESGFRAGVEAVPNIVGFGAAAELAAAELGRRQKHLTELSTLLRQSLKQDIPGLRFLVPQEHCVPGLIAFTLAGLEAEAVVLGLDEFGIAATMGSACNAMALKPSHVLSALGLSEAEAKATLLFGLGKDTRPEEIQNVVENLGRVVERLRALSTVEEEI